MKKLFFYKYKINKDFYKFTKQSKNIKLEDIFLNDNLYKCYLKYKSIEDLEINELTHVIKSNKINELCDSALTTFKIKKEKLSENFNLLNPKENFNLNINEKEQIINKQIIKYTKIRIKFRKNEKQITILEREFKKNPFGSNLKMNEIAEESGLSFKQIYKGKWDNSLMG